MTSKKHHSNPLTAPAQTVPVLSAPAPGAPLEATVNMAPAAAAKLTGESPERTAASLAAESALPGWQSLGKDHKPTHANGKQGRREKKVRW
ncbi:hypothetical protein QNO08_15755 [Arthrobacter sp. zg-Y820]|uniref:hypothetical protein n=1 Tax=unclassified Arthrobacter TaxID=235627 RepID=UPI001E58AAC4|nr:MULTISPECIES: hypothetical protein [unclassified Arthrobacter]MCC9197094.1 hypothetical protein [Arthrobacter sp. zg-Y820]MDK1279959.1 hypothetical protein [Arthrobacter sp. zg.Y820]WIB09258.1 hypothetical protein QNO08_15755 [Arthrobacter sp. zg-Y820]